MVVEAKSERTRGKSNRRKRQPDHHRREDYGQNAVQVEAPQVGYAAV